MAKTGWSTDPRTALAAGKGFSLADVDTRSTPGFDGDKRAGQALLAARALELDALQEKLYVAGRFGDTRSILLVLQAMDTAGKGGTVRHVFAGTDPQGVSITAFKAPTPEEREHDFLWRIRPRLPRPGYIGVFDRSHYEDVLVHRVRGFSTPAAIEERYGIINDFEAELAASGTTVVKVMLHISRQEQKERLMARLETPEKNWKYNPHDLDDRALWPQFQEAYQIAIERTSTADAPWFVVPADRKWYARIVVQHLVIDALERFDLQWPKADYDVEAEKARLAAS